MWMKCPNLGEGIDWFPDNRLGTIFTTDFAGQLWLSLILPASLCRHQTLPISYSLVMEDDDDVDTSCWCIIFPSRIHACLSICKIKLKCSSKRVYWSWSSPMSAAQECTKQTKNNNSFHYHVDFNWCFSHSTGKTCLKSNYYLLQH